jgi:hypothetical protein
MKRVMAISLAIALVLTAGSALAGPSKDSVGLGVSFGAAFPQHKTDEIQFDDWDTSFAWGFYVNIPLIWTFHITPSAELYKFNDANATDINLAFKFIIPASILDIYVGIAPGLTTVMDDTLFNVGGVLGVSFNLFSNLDMFVEAKYKILIEGDSNVRVLHACAGMLYHF